MHVAYLEIVTSDVDAVCATWEAVHGVSFSPPVPALGGARTARLDGGGRIGVRAPLRDDEEPVVRPYFATPDVSAGAARAEAEGALVAHPAMALPGQGTFSILIEGGVQTGLWRDEEEA